MQHVREVALGIAAMLWTSSSIRWGSAISAYFDASTLAECGGGREGICGKWSAGRAQILLGQVESQFALALALFLPSLMVPFAYMTLSERIITGHCFCYTTEWTLSFPHAVFTQLWPKENTSESKEPGNTIGHLPTLYIQGSVKRWSLG